MAFPVVQGAAHTATAGGTTSHTFDLPTGVQAGEMLLALCTDSAIGARDYSDLAGWNKILNTNESRNLATFWRWADGTEGATATITISSNAALCVSCYRISGAQNVAPAVANTASTTSTNPDPPSLSPSWGAEDTLWFAFAGWNSRTTAPSAYPSNYSDNQNTLPAVSGQAASLGVATRNLNASSENPGVFTMASSTWRAATLAVRPAAVVVGQPYAKRLGGVPGTHRNGIGRSVW
jgi:hypothetical protein